jgi:hypothetical protein
MSASYIPQHLERWEPGAGATGWDSAANYCGADLSAFYVAPIHRNRDTADSVTLSNWRVIEAALDAASQHDESGVTRIGHWACGWYELYLIHESDAAALEIADNWAAALSDYPVADESDLSDLECQLESEAWDAYGAQQWRDAIEAALDELGPDDAPYGWAADIAERLTDEQLYSSWHELTERCGWHCYHESDGARFNIDEPAELLTAERLTALTGEPLQLGLKL